MTTRKHSAKSLNFIGLGLLAISPLVTLSAQDVDLEDQEDVYVLSPFTVSAEEEQGYQATHTLSGNRMRTDLQDVGASIDVLTQEFMDDIAAVDMYDALDYVGNVDTWASSGAHEEQSNREWWSVPYFSRGFIGDTVMTDFFTRYEFPDDSYNTEALTVSRGPNSVLYGIGRPGGTINATRKRPVFGRNFTVIRALGNSYGGARVAADYNYEILEDKLGVRVAAVMSDKKGFRDPAKDARSGLYLAAKWQPFEGTTVTFTAEDASQERIIGSNMVAYDGVTPWINAGRPTIANWGDSINGSYGSGLDAIGSSQRIVRVIGQSIPVMSWAGGGRSEYWEIPGVDYTANERKTSFTEDTAIFDLTTNISGPDATADYWKKDYALFLEQKIMDGLFLELAYNRIDMDSEVIRAGRPHDWVFVDVNEQLPDGSANPNVGVPYYEIDRGEANHHMVDYETKRATLSYEVDLNETKVMGFGIGRYNLFAMYEDFDWEDVYGGVYREVDISDPDGNWSSSSARIRSRVYLNSSITPSGTSGTYDNYFYDFSPINENGYVSGWVPFGAPRHIFDKRESFVWAFQGHLWQTEEGWDRITFMYGNRSDDTSSQSTSYSKTSNRVYQGEHWSGKYPSNKSDIFASALEYGSLNDAEVTDGSTETYSVMFRPTEKVTLYYTYSDVLMASTSLKPDIYGRQAPSTVGDTVDFGVRFKILDDRLVGSITFFDTAANDQAFNSIRNDINGYLENMFRTIDENHQYADLDERWHAFRTDRTDGMEFALTSNIGNFRGRLSISQQNTVIDKQMAIVDQFMSEFSGLWQDNSSLALVDPYEGTGILTVGDALAETRRIIANYHAVEGSVPESQREWKINFTGNYRFNDGILKNWSVGGNYRWQSSDILGYALDSEGINDPSQPFKGEELSRVDAFVSYGKKLFDDKVDMTVQLNIRNLFDDSDSYPRIAYDNDGSAYFGQYQMREPRSFILSLKLSM